MRAVRPCALRVFLNFVILPLVCNVVRFARIKWEEKMETQKHIREKTSLPLTLSSFTWLEETKRVTIGDRVWRAAQAALPPRVRPSCPSPGAIAPLLRAATAKTTSCPSRTQPPKRQRAHPAALATAPSHPSPGASNKRHGALLTASSTSSSSNKPALENHHGRTEV